MAVMLAEGGRAVTVGTHAGGESVMVAGRPASIDWRRSARARRVALKIDPQAGSIVITLPPRGSRHAGLALLRSHEDWVAARLAALPDLTIMAAGSTIPVCGVPHLIVHDPGHRGRATIIDGKIYVAGQPAFVARRVRDALADMAMERFSAQASLKAATFGRRVRLVRIRDTTSRWGSCTADGTLMFSWRLIMAPDFVQDYVIGHEVAHLRHMDHGPLFWTLVETLTNHRAAATRWLSGHGAGLLRIM